MIAHAQSYTWGYRVTSGSTALSTDPWTVGSGTNDYLLVGVGYNGVNGSGILNAAPASSTTINVGRFFVGINSFYNPTLSGNQGNSGNGANGTGTLYLGTNNTITASQIFIGGNDADENTGLAGGSVGTVTTAAGGTTTITTPSMTLGNSKGNNGYFTLGSNATLNLGSSGNRTTLGLGVLYVNNNNTARTVSGSMGLEASGAVATLYLKSLQLSYTPAGSTGGNRDGTLTLSSNASNVLNVSGTGTVVQIGVGSGAAGSFTAGSMTGLLRIGNLGSSSIVESTDNATAIMVGAKPSGAGASINGTLDFKAGTLTIKTTGTGIAGGGGNTSSLLLGETGAVTLKAGAASTDFVGGLGTATLRSFGAIIDTNGFDIAMSQAFSGTGGLTKSGAGSLTLTGSNSYSGGTTISTGTLRIGNGGTTGSISGNVVSAAALVFNRSDAVAYAGTISGTGSLSQLGTGVLTLSAVQSYSGRTVIAGGTLALASGASLASNSIKAGDSAGGGGTFDVTDLSGGLQLASGQTLGGHGTVRGNVVVGAGSFIAPGGSIGTLTQTGTQTWAPLGTYTFEVTNAGGTAAGGWDLLNVDALQITASSGAGNQFVVGLQSLTNGTDTSPGPMSGGNWDPNTNYQWKFVVAGAPISSFDSSWFNVDTSNFQNTFNAGGFSVARGDQVSGGTTNELYVVYAAVPEPGTLALAAAGGITAAWVAVRKRRRRRAAAGS